MSSRIIVIAVGIAVVGLGIISYMKISSSRDVLLTGKAPFMTDNSERLRESIKQAAAEQQKRLHQTFERLTVELKEVSEAGFAEALQGISPAVTALTSAKMIWKLVYAKATGGDPDSLISPILERCIIKHCIAADAEIQARVQSFAQALHAEILAFHGKIAKDVSGARLKAIVDMQALKTFEDSINNAQSLTQKIAESGIYTGIGVTLEALFIRQTCAAIVKAVAPVVTARLTGTAVAAGVISQLDSPLPGPMDLAAGGIAVAGLAWTAYDVYAVGKILPEQLRSMLEQAVNDYQKNSLDAALKQASEIQRKYSETLGVFVMEAAK